MAIWTVHAPPEAGSMEAEAAGVRFVRDGFSFWALILPGLWFLWHRLWLAFLGWLAAMVAIALFERAAGGIYAGVVSIALGLLIGLEARDVERWTLDRRGWRFLGVVEGGDRDIAERRFFAAWLAPRAAAPDGGPAAVDDGPAAPGDGSVTAAAPVPQPWRPASVPRVPRPGTTGVIGLFPTSGGREG